MGFSNSPNHHSRSAINQPVCVNEVMLRSTHIELSGNNRQFHAVQTNCFFSLSNKELFGMALAARTVIESINAHNIENFVEIMVPPAML